ncbi:MAG: hypothetical protein LBV28_01405 [Puniceicoccales bacterium]|jgi:hypothetical protein|nr:hypothetical protein [Puniceicoccales bacterium]
MKNIRTLSLFAFAGAAAVALSGCGTDYETAGYGPSIQIEPSYNFFGIVKTTPASFLVVPSTSVHVSSSDLTATRDYSGNNVSLLWGAITFTDY